MVHFALKTKKKTPQKPSRYSMVNLALGGSAKSTLTQESGGKTTLQATCVEVNLVPLALQCKRKTPENSRFDLPCWAWHTLHPIMKRKSRRTLHAKGKVFHHCSKTIQCPPTVLLTWAGSETACCFESGVNEAAERRTTVKNGQQQCWPVLNLFPGCPQLFISPIYVALPQHDLSMR